MNNLVEQLLKERAFCSYLLRELPGTILHENALIMVPFDHILRVIVFESDTYGELKIRAGYLPLFVPTNAFDGTIFREIGRFSMFQDLNTLRSLAVQCIKRQGLPFLSDVNFRFSVKDYYNFCFIEEYGLRILAYSSLLSLDPDESKYWIQRLLKRLKKKVHTSDVIANLEEVYEFAELLNDNPDKARSFLLSIEERTMRDLKMLEFEKYRFRDEMQLFRSVTQSSLGRRYCMKSNRHMKDCRHAKKIGSAT